ncbi:MAG: M14 family metallopeptidase [Armatimonadia bacterium]
MSQFPAVSFESYYQHDALSGHLQAVAAARPDRVKLHRLYTTAEGREEWLVELTDFSNAAPERKPAYLVHANVHAVEVSGTTASLVLIEDLLTDPEYVGLLEEVVFYVIPRVNPDGAEYALTTGGQIRSKYEYRPRKNGLVGQDLNGDGLVLTMRWQDPYGTQRPDDEDPRLMISRKAGDTGPFYHVVREGLIEDYDGGSIQEAVRGFDFNRNWGYNWQREHLQYGAGDYAFSNPEMKALADWVYSHPNIFGMLGFHNGCNSVLRASATVPDEEMDPSDLHTMKEIGEIGERLTGFGLRAVRDYRTDRSKPLSLKGHFTDWGYFNLGLFAYEIELGNMYNAAGITTAEYFAADAHTREILYGRQIMKYADSIPDAFVDWKPFEHPQLGPVEIGGLRSTCWATPPPQALEGIGHRCAHFIVEHAQRCPRLEIHNLAAEHVGGQIYRLTATVANVGALATQISEQGHRIAANGPVTVRLLASEGVEVLSRSNMWEFGALHALTGHAEVECFVRAQEGAQVKLRAEAPKAGVVEQVARLTG